MSKFKVGDQVKVRIATDLIEGFEYGEIGTVIELEHRHFDVLVSFTDDRSPVCFFNLELEAA